MTKTNKNAINPNPESDSEKELRKLREANPEMFTPLIMETHDFIVKQNPDLHQGKAVGFDGNLNQGHTIPLETRPYRMAQSVEQLPDDVRDELFSDSGNLY